MTLTAATLVLVAGGAIGWRKLHVAELEGKKLSAVSSPPSASEAKPQPIETSLASKATTPIATEPAKKPVTHHAHATPPTLAPSGATLAVAPPTVVPSPPVTPQPAADAPATLAIAIAPWCDLTIDGHPRGRSPATLTLPPGPHHLVCINPVSGNRLTRDLTLSPAERRELREQLYAMVRVQPRLTRGDAFAIDGSKPASSPSSVEPGRRRVTLYQAGSEIETRWLDIPPSGCTLVDAPRLSCEKP